MRNNPSGGSSSPIRWILIAIAILLVVGISVYSIIYFGVFRAPGTSVGTPTAASTPISTVANNPGRGGACFGSPYGFTTIHADSQLVTFYKQLNVCWVRYQFHWSKIETSNGVYDWSQVDAAIATMNAANIHVDFAIQDAPDWHRTQICSGDGKPFLPGPAEMATFATAIATRYDSQHGHGYIDAFEIGNEEYDNHFVPGLGNNQPCRSASYYEPVLKAGYQAIKAVNPKILVGMFGMWWHYQPHIQEFMTQLYTDGYGKYMDYMNFHYYHSGGDPSVTSGQDPSFDGEWQMMHDIATHFGFGSKPIWVTEVGWPTSMGFGVSSTVTPEVQAQYMQYILNESAKSRVVTKVFWFTIDYGHQSDNIVPPSGPLPAFQVMKTMVQQRPQWS